MKLFFFFFIYYNSPSCVNIEQMDIMYKYYFETLYKLMEADQFYNFDNFPDLASRNYDMVINNYWRRWKSKEVENNLTKLFYYIKNFIDKMDIDEETITTDEININEQLLIEDENEAQKFLKTLKLEHRRNVSYILAEGYNRGKIQRKTERKESAEMTAKKNKKK